MKNLTDEFNQYFHEVLLNDEIYLELSAKYTDHPFNMEFEKGELIKGIEEAEYHQLELLIDAREDYIHSYCLKMYNRRN